MLILYLSILFLFNFSFRRDGYIFANSGADRGRTVSIWGGVCLSGPQQIRRLHSRLDTRQYLDILLELSLNGTSHGFVRDHHPVHRSLFVREWFESTLNLLPRPPRSEDLMPMWPLQGHISFSYSKCKFCLHCHSVRFR